MAKIEIFVFPKQFDLKQAFKIWIFSYQSKTLQNSEQAKADFTSRNFKQNEQ